MNLLSLLFTVASLLLIAQTIYFFLVEDTNIYKKYTYDLQQFNFISIKSGVAFFFGVMITFYAIDMHELSDITISRILLSIFVGVITAFSVLVIYRFIIIHLQIRAKKTHTFHDLETEVIWYDNLQAEGEVAILTKRGILLVPFRAKGQFHNGDKVVVSGNYNKVDSIELKK
ncbi:MAG: hypothetical protein LBR81_02460 [Prevotellaceae bacterium]|jgi:hypothetical protein|nr:hypothetical protein [Prevotellaceae bacterium]